MTEMYLAYGIDPKQSITLKDLEDLIGKPVPKVNLRNFVIIYINISMS